MHPKLSLTSVRSCSQIHTFLTNIPPIFLNRQAMGRSFFPHALCGLQRSWGVRESTVLLPVDSCFGGLALYREEVLDCSYEDVETQMNTFFKPRCFIITDLLTDS